MSLTFRAGQDSFRGVLRTLTRNRDRAFELLKLALTRPRFDADAVERDAKPDFGWSPPKL